MLDSVHNYLASLRLKNGRCKIGTELHAENIVLFFMPCLKPLWPIHTYIHNIYTYIIYIQIYIYMYINAGINNKFTNKSSGN